MGRAFTAPGTCTLNASQAGNGDYRAAAQLSQTSVVAKAATTLVAAAADKGLGLTPVTVSATLTRTDDKRPIAGQTIACSVSTTGLCAAKTSATGDLHRPA